MKKNITYYELKIDETARNSIQSVGTRRFNTIVQKFESLDDVKEYIIEKYGKMPGMRNKVYVDDKNHKSVECGFTHSFWDKDWSHMGSKSWYQTDWVSVKKITKFEKIILL